MGYYPRVASNHLVVTRFPQPHAPVNLSWLDGWKRTTLHTKQYAYIPDPSLPKVKTPPKKKHKNQNK